MKRQDIEQIKGVVEEVVEVKLEEKFNYLNQKMDQNHRELVVKIDSVKRTAIEDTDKLEKATA